MSADESIQLVERFWQEVWAPPYNIDVIDELLSEDFEFDNAGSKIVRRAAFKEWVKAFGGRISEARLVPLETFATADGSKVASRWRGTGKNNGMFGLPADGQPIEFTGISIWHVRNGKLASHFLERSAFELYQRLRSDEQK